MANEKRLIDANAVLKWLEEITEPTEWLVSQYNADWIWSMIDSYPTVDAVEVVHAEWQNGCGLHNGNITYYSIDCSNCQGIFKAKSRADVEHWKEQFKVCPFCGAKMDGDGNG